MGPNILAQPGVPSAPQERRYMDRPHVIIRSLSHDILELHLPTFDGDGRSVHLTGITFALQQTWREQIGHAPPMNCTLSITVTDNTRLKQPPRLY